MALPETGCSGNDPGTGAGGDGGSEPSCASPRTTCDGSCIDTSQDPGNCGACGKACDVGETCTAGQCGLTCPSTQTKCDDACIDTTNDRAHCGDCDVACGDGEVCSQGNCALSCGGGTTLCDDTCANTNLDPKHCGDCATTCGPDEVCSNGTCGSSFTGGTSACAGACVDEQNDPLNCGGCLTPCDVGDFCSAGSCTSGCGATQTACDDLCVDTDTDPANCGGCGQPCTGGEVCSAGVCGLSCVGGATKCGNLCVDTDIDAANCGGCGNPCASGESCVDGTCALVCTGGTTKCGNVWVSTANDPANCGSCGSPCAVNDACVSGACKPLVVVATSCKDLHAQQPGTGSGTYTIDIDGAGPMAPFQVYCDMTTAGGGWTRCLDFLNTPAVDVDNNTWFDDCIDWSMLGAPFSTELLFQIKDGTGASVYSGTGNRLVSWTHSQVTSTVAAGNQYDVAQHARLVTLSTGDKLMITGNTAQNGGCLGSLGNGYGLTLFPAAPSGATVKALVMPYFDQVGDHGKRAFGSSNSGWFMDNEVSFNAATMDLCVVNPVKAQLGNAWFFVR